ncbi:MAG: hypothetical protein AB1698_01675 [Pseudomonadota bacterium]
MTETTEPMTELEAVNTLLEAIGQIGVSSLLPEASNAYVEQALREVRRTSRDVQKRGWHWNTLKVFPLTPDAEGNIVLPINTLKVDTVERSKGEDVAQRGRKLFDRRRHTFLFDRVLYVDLVESLEWEDLPSAAQWYITVKAVRRFATKKLASDSALRFTQSDEQEAYMALEQDDAEADDRTMLQASPHVARMRRR